MEKVLVKIGAVLFDLYVKIAVYLHFQNFHKRHFAFRIDKGRLLITSTSHDHFVSIVQKRLDKAVKKKKTAKFIKLALVEAMGGCNYIIFYTREDEYKFVQFWTAGKKLNFDVSINKENKLKRYYYPVIGLLACYGFVNKKNENYRGKNVFEVSEGITLTTIGAWFEGDADKASEVTEKVFREIYGIKKNRIRARVG